MATIRKRGGKFQLIVRRGYQIQAKTFFKRPATTTVNDKKVRFMLNYLDVNSDRHSVKFCRFWSICIS